LNAKIGLVSINLIWRLGIQKVILEIKVLLLSLGPNLVHEECS